MSESELEKNDRWVRARLAANQRLGHEWGVKIDRFAAYKTLKIILGKDLHRNLYEQFNEKDYETCQLLLGPNGYAIFKMLCHKRGYEP